MKIDDIKTKEKIGEGSYGICYLMDNDYVLKKLKKPLPVSDIDKFRYFLNYKNDSIMFPVNFIYDDIYLYGHISKRAYGRKLFDIFSSSNLLKMSTHSIKLENNIKYISKGKIMINDLHDENILYDENKFSIIDTDDYVRAGSLYSEKEIEKRNVNYYKRIIKALTLFSSVKFKCNKYIVDRTLKYEKLSMSGSEMLYKIKCDLDNYYKEDIKSMDDIRNISR